MRKEKRAARPKNINKKLVLVISVIVLMAAAVGTTVAYIVTETNSIKNVFNAGELTCAVEETVEGNVKSDVLIANTSDTVSAYIRAEVLVNWVDENGSISVDAPIEGVDYVITYAEGTGWDTETADGYCYYTSPVAPLGKTGVLIAELKPIADKEGFTLKADILANAIQSEPVSVVREIWGVTVSGTAISK